LYFNVTVQAEEGKVFFYETKKKRNFLSERFNVIIEMNDKTKLFFRPPRFWDAHITIQNKWPQIFYSHLLGDVLHGFETNNAPGTKTLLFEPPFFFVFKTSNIDSNFLSFIDFQKSNSESTILAMINFDDERNVFHPEYSPELFLPYTDGLSLNTVLEFTLHDSKNNLVQVADKSQLFIVLTLL
jgi:hypothetical protein